MYTKFICFRKMAHFLSLNPLLSAVSSASSFTSNCEEVVKQRGEKRMLFGIHHYDAVNRKNPERNVKYLMPLRNFSALAGPVKMDIGDGDTFLLYKGNSVA